MRGSRFAAGLNEILAANNSLNWRARTRALFLWSSQEYVLLQRQAMIGRSHRKNPQREPSAQLQDTVRLSADGLAKVLGDLEARVMRAVWSIGQPAPVRAIHAEVVREHPVAVLTVTTVLNKLAAKKLLSRRRRADLLHYEARLTEQEFLAQASRRVMEGVMSLAPEAMASSFVDVMAERDPEQLAELARLIRRRLDGRSKP